MVKMTVYEVVKNIIGSIEPIGDSGVDEKRLANLKETIELTESLLRDIGGVAVCVNNYQDSMKHAGKIANGFLADIEVEYHPVAHAAMDGQGKGGAV